MDSETVHGTVRSGVGSVPEAGPLFWSQWTLDGSAEAWRRAAGVHPGQTGSSLPEKGLNTATGAAGEGGNEKAVMLPTY